MDNKNVNKQLDRFAAKFNKVFNGTFPWSRADIYELMSDAITTAYKLNTDEQKDQFDKYTVDDIVNISPEIYIITVRDNKTGHSRNVRVALHPMGRGRYFIK